MTNRANPRLKKAAALAALISSPGHRRNILSRGYTKVGVGVALDENGYVYLTQIFCR